MRKTILKIALFGLLLITISQKAVAQYPFPTIKYNICGNLLGTAGGKLIMVDTYYNKLYSADTINSPQLIYTWPLNPGLLSFYTYTSTHFYFAKFNANKLTIYKTDGVSLDSIYQRAYSGTASQSEQGDLLNINDSIYFFSNDSIFREDPNGTVTSIVWVSDYKSMIKFGNNLVFDTWNMNDSISIFDVVTSSVVATPSGKLIDYLEVNQDFYFTGATINGQGVLQIRLAKIDGQTYSTIILDTNYYLAGILGELNNKILCWASPNSSPNDIELYSYDPITFSATLIKDIFPGTTGSMNQSINGIRTTHQIFFAADDSLHGKELWVTDGTNAGTHLVYDYTPGIGGSDFYYDFGKNRPSDWAYIKGDTMIGTARIGSGGTYYTQMCVTDGNIFYTIDLHPGSTPGNIFEHPRFFTPWNREIYYQLEVTPAPWGYICKFNPDILTGFYNLNETEEIRIFPNPANSNFKVEANSFDDSAINFFTISGSIIFESSFDKEKIINLENIYPGIYILELRNKMGQTQHVRFTHE